jgi:hypothetical protein
MELQLTELIGKALWACRRAADMATFQFGRRNPVQTFDGRSSEVGDYSLHVQCPWRMVKGESVFVGSQDLYFPASYDASESIPEGFQWDTDPNRRDSLLKAFFEGGTKEFVVSRVDAGKGGAARIEFAEGITLEVFPADSLAHEHWRLIAHEGGPQIVMTGVGPKAK